MGYILGVIGRVLILIIVVFVIYALLTTKKQDQEDTKIESKAITPEPEPKQEIKDVVQDPVTVKQKPLSKKQRIKQNKAEGIACVLNVEALHYQQIKKV